MMKRLVLNVWLCLCAAVCALQFTACNDNDDYDIYLLIGQSNCAGRGYLLPEDTLNVLEGVWLLNDELVPEKTKSRRLELRHKFAIPSEKKVILYAPTFREYEKEGANCVLSLPVDFTKWQKKLGNEYVLLLRAHHEVVKLMNVSENEFLKNVSNYPNLNELMIVSDILISDYSSILFDYSIQAKPMFCFAYDYDQYEKERGFYFDIRKELSNEGLDNEERLLEALLNMNIQERIKITENFRDKYIQAYGDAGEKSLDIIYSSIHDDN